MPILPIWSVAPVSRTPSITLEEWMIVETDKKQRHFVGYNHSGYEGRVSSAIVQFDKDSMSGVTSSGRVYQLKGAPGVNSDAVFVWGYWRQFNGVKTWVDVTAKALDGE